MHFLKKISYIYLKNDSIDTKCDARR